MSERREFFTAFGQWVAILSFAVLFLWANLFAARLFQAIQDPHPSFVLPPDSSHTRKP